MAFTRNTLSILRLMLSFVRHTQQTFSFFVRPAFSRSSGTLIQTPNFLTDTQYSSPVVLLSSVATAARRQAYAFRAQGAETRLTSDSKQDAAHPPCDSSNTSRRSALGASKIFLVDENPTYSVPALWGYKGLWSYDYGHACHEFTPSRTSMMVLSRLLNSGRVWRGPGTPLGVMTVLSDTCRWIRERARKRKWQKKGPQQFNDDRSSCRASATKRKNKKEMPAQPCPGLAYPVMPVHVHGTDRAQR